MKTERKRLKKMGKPSHTVFTPKIYILGYENRIINSCTGNLSVSRLKCRSKW